MFDTLVLALSLAVALFVGYLILKAYKPTWFQGSSTIEKFVPKAMGPPAATLINTPALPTPSPAPPVRQDPPQEERTVAPGGPAAPNAEAPPDTRATISPEAAPIDPYEDRNMEAPIKDSMRHPELSFGPGVNNTGTAKLTASGVGSDRALTSESPFSPDFAQNGGTFMGAVSANDLSHDDSYATA